MLSRYVQTHNQTGYGSASAVHLTEDRIMFSRWCLRGFLTVSLLVLGIGCDKDSNSGTDPDPVEITFTYCTTSFQTVIENNDEGQGYDFKGELCMNDYNDPARDINIGNITARYGITRFFGEPVSSTSCPGSRAMIPSLIFIPSSSGRG